MKSGCRAPQWYELESGRRIRSFIEVVDRRKAILDRMPQMKTFALSDRLSYLAQTYVVNTRIDQSEWHSTRPISGFDGFVVSCFDISEKRYVVVKRRQPLVCPATQLPSQPEWIKASSSSAPLRSRPLVFMKIPPSLAPLQHLLMCRSLVLGRIERIPPQPERL